MKTPKEKAEELVNRFDVDTIYVMTKPQAKQCALIDIKNSIKLLNDVFNEFIEDYSFPQSKKISRKLDELIKVKEEIENLNN